MDCPPELEKAEAELQMYFQKERVRTKWSLADTLIGLAMGATSLGMACGLIRILDLTPNRLNRINNDKTEQNP